MSDAMLDAIQSTLDHADAPDDVRAGMVTRYVTVYELLDADGERKLDIHAGPDLRVWDVLGLLSVAVVDARMQAEACWDDDGDDDE
jgi:hypothetical protein